MKKNTKLLLSGLGAAGLAYALYKMYYSKQPEAVAATTAPVVTPVSTTVSRPPSVRTMTVLKPKILTALNKTTTAAPALLARV